LWPEVVEHHGNDPVATAPGSDFVYPHSGHIAAIRVLTQSLWPAGRLSQHLGVLAADRRCIATASHPAAQPFRGGTS